MTKRSGIDPWKYKWCKELEIVVSLFNKWPKSAELIGSFSPHDMLTIGIVQW